ncbi:histone-like nucleoid-structuring protein MvaT [Pseudomonas sp. F1_0610]|uniref:histone-like nucleoid-structuring protein MvaT n=1 Tax=Pseudomonas sp. F1_0610 TaxID=3114284 RepID=UPI0039C4E310
MSLINEFRSTKNEIEELQKRLESLKQDTRLQKELEFEEKLRALMGEYSKSLRDIIAILDPQALSSAPTKSQARSTRKPRSTKRYTNPHSKKVIETKGGNHKVLKEWKAQYGNDVVEGWVELID